MNIIEAARKGGKITGGEVEKRNDEYWYFDESGEVWDEGGISVPMTKDCLLADDYEPYEPQIVPKDAGELWYHVSGNYGHTYFKPLGSGPGGQICYMDDVFKDKPVAELIDPVHGKNGWTRLRPEVPDPNIEKVVIENTTWPQLSKIFDRFNGKSIKIIISAEKRTKLDYFGQPIC